MPTYEYQCESCLHVWEQHRPASERNDSIDCPECGGKGSSQRVFKTPPGLPWYQDCTREPMRG